MSIRVSATRSLQPALVVLSEAKEGCAARLPEAPSGKLEVKKCKITP